MTDTLDNLIFQAKRETRTAPGDRKKVYVVARDGTQRPIQFDRITERLDNLCSDEYGDILAAVETPLITARVADRVRCGMTTRALDEETAAICAQMASHHTDYGRLAARIHVSDFHKRTPADIMAITTALGGERLSEEYAAIVRRASVEINEALDFSRDYRFQMFGWQTIARRYLMRVGGPCTVESTLQDTQVAERPQHLYMRTALGIFVCQPDRNGHLAPDDVFAQRLRYAFQFYDALSLHLVSNATPTILNSATRWPQLSSCFQMPAPDDLSGLMDTVKSLAMCSKWSGGCSVWLHGMRAAGSRIKSTGGESSGIRRYVKVIHEVQQWVDQGGNRPGAFAVYLSVDHDDIFTLLSMARVKGEDALKSINAPRLKYALWIPDDFMETLVEALENPDKGDWYLFSPDEAPGLHLVWGDEYKALKARYIAEGRYRRCVKVRTIIDEVFKTWSQVGTPYILFKDAINRKSNMQNVAPICSSNLCAEITIPCWAGEDVDVFKKFHPGNTEGEHAVCNLAAVCLGSFVKTRAVGSRLSDMFDFAGVAAAAGMEVRVLNRVIDVSFYPTPEGKRSNRRHRPVGVGIMGLADALAMMGIAWGSLASRRFARGVSAAVYWGALSASCDLAATDGPYETYEGSPISQGLLQPDLWVREGKLEENWESEVFDVTGGVIDSRKWAALRESAKRGVRNAYVTAYMPTATTSGIVGQNESFEPFTSNVYPRTTLSGEFMIVNQYLQSELSGAGLWTESIRRSVLSAGGSIQEIPEIPDEIKLRSRTAREIHPQRIVQMAAAMAPFICQSMSLNLFLKEADLPSILGFLLSGWRAGLKTGLYYMHTQPAAGTQKTSVRPVIEPSPPPEPEIGPTTCSGDAGCTSCAL